MRRALIAFILAALTQPSSAHADGPPSWISRAERIVARIHVPNKDVSNKQDGTGFFVGLDDRTLYLVTASHVIWPKNIPGYDPPNNLPGDDKVNLEVEVPGCAHLPAVADSTQASPIANLDVAVVKISLTELPNDIRAACKQVLDNIKQLPRHILDPDADQLEQHTRAWFIGPGDKTEGLDSRPLTFEKQSEEKNALEFSGRITNGDSGAPVFSDRGHLIGMAIKQPAVATRFRLILALLHSRKLPVPTNLAGSFSMLSFSDRKDAHLRIDDADEVRLEPPPPAPLGWVSLTARVDGSKLVTGSVYVEGPRMDCDVHISHWPARHKPMLIYTTVSLLAATGIAYTAARLYEHSFEQSPSTGSYGHVMWSNGITIGAGLAALTSLGVTFYGYHSSAVDRITCMRRDGAEVPR